MEKGAAATLRPRGERKSTSERRQEIVRAAAKTFGTKGYQKGSLIAIAEQVGMTHAGVLHHFGSKEQLLIAVLEYRDAEDLQGLGTRQLPQGMELFWHLTRTASRTPGGKASSRRTRRSPASPSRRTTQPATS